MNSNSNPVEEARMRIFRYIKQFIRKNRLQQGDRLPSENTLATQFGVNRNIVRSALAQLKAQGLIYSEKGRGFFVATYQKPIIFEHENGMGFSEILDQGHRNYQSEIIRYTCIDAGPSESQVFQVPVGTPLHSLKTLRIMDDTPFAICHSILPATLFPDFDQHLEGFFSVNHIIMTHYGYPHPVCQKISLEACSPTTEDIRYMQIPNQMPILKQNSIFASDGFGVVEHFIVRAPSDRFHFSMSFQDPKE